MFNSVKTYNLLMKILIVEDEAKTIKFLSKGLKEEGCTVASAQDGETGLELASTNDFDVIILDINLPRLSGFQVCKKLRQRNRKMPILMLTARETVDNRIEGLDSGADDYLIKPFSFGELMARLRALSRRTADQENSLTIGDLKIDLVSHKATHKGEGLELSNQEYSLLQLFMRRKGHILSRTLIAESAWNHDFDTETNVIDVYVTFLRKKLKTVTGKNWIQTHRGRGYSFEEPE